MPKKATPPELVVGVPSRAGLPPARASLYPEADPLFSLGSVLKPGTSADNKNRALSARQKRRGRAKPPPRGAGGKHGV